MLLNKLLSVLKCTCRVGVTAALIDVTAVRREEDMGRVICIVNKIMLTSKIGGEARLLFLN